MSDKQQKADKEVKRIIDLQLSKEDLLTLKKKKRVIKNTFFSTVVIHPPGKTNKGDKQKR